MERVRWLDGERGEAAGGGGRGKCVAEGQEVDMWRSGREYESSAEAKTREPKR